MATSQVYLPRVNFWKDENKEKGEKHANANGD